MMEGDVPKVLCSQDPGTTRPWECRTLCQVPIMCHVNIGYVGHLEHKTMGTQDLETWDIWNIGPFVMFL